MNREATGQYHHPGKAELPAQFLARSGLPEADRRLLKAAVVDVHHIERGGCIREQGEQARFLSILLDGIAHAVRVLRDGRQQIIALYVAGDVMDCQPAAAPAPSRLCGVTPCRIAQIPFGALADLSRENPVIAHALWHETTRHMAIQQEWLVALGRHNSHARLAHFICEVSVRFRAAGLGDGDSCPLPMTQADISDALGISVVHVNRVLQQLRKEGLVALSHGTLHIIDHAALYEAADFDPVYLGLDAEAM